MDTVSLLQDDGSVRVLAAPVGAWHTPPIGDCDREQLLADAQTLGRGLAACESRLDAVRRHVPTIDDHVRLHHDAAGWLRERLPSEAAALARDGLERLLAALGPDGAIGDATDAGLPTPTLTLHHAGERLADIEAEIQRVQSAFVPRAANGRRAG